MGVKGQFDFFCIMIDDVLHYHPSILLHKKLIENPHPSPSHILRICSPHYSPLAATVTNNVPTTVIEDLAATSSETAGDIDVVGVGTDSVTGNVPAITDLGIPN